MPVAEIRKAEYGDRALMDKNLDSSGTTFQTTEAAPEPVKVGEVYRRKAENDVITIEGVSAKWVFYVGRGNPYKMNEKGRVVPADVEAKVQSGEWTKLDYSEPQDFELIGSAEYREIRADLRKLAAYTKNADLAKQAALDAFNISIIKSALAAIAGAILAAGDPKLTMIWGVAKAWVDKQEKDLKQSREPAEPARDFDYYNPSEFPFMG